MNKKQAILGCVLAALGAGGAAPSQRTQQAEAKAGLTAVLADDEKLIMALSERELEGLCQYMFARNKVPAEQQAAYKAVASLKRLDDATLTPQQKAEVVKNVAAGIDRVLGTQKDPEQVMRLAAELIEHGTKAGLNLLEYWGEDPAIQAQVRPVAEAVGRAYEKAIALAEAQEGEAEKRMTAANQAEMGALWEKAAKNRMTGKFNAAFNQYTLALSMDAADAQRKAACDAGIKLMEEFEDEQYEVVATAKLCIGKLLMSKRGAENLKAAKAKFAQALKDEKATWEQKFEAQYFAAVAEVVGNSAAEARKALGTVGGWLKTNAAPDEKAKKGTEAALRMLEYRICQAEARAAEGRGASAEARKANDAAIEVLQKLLKEQPELEGIINRQMLALQPARPEVEKLNPLLLKAMVAKASDEAGKGPEGKPDGKLIEQGIAAARELMRRGSGGGVSTEDVERYALVVGVFHERLGQDLEAANAFLHFARTYQKDLKLANDVLDNAGSVIARLKKNEATAAASQEAYERFLELASNKPFERKEVAFAYAYVLLQRNAGLMEGNVQKQRGAILGNANKAIDLLGRIADQKQKLQAASYQMLAYDQMLDAWPEAPDAGRWAGRIQDLAVQITAQVQKELPQADEAAQRTLRRYHVRAILLAADLADHQKGANRVKSLERAVNLLANIEKDVEGLSDGTALLSEGLLMRLKALMELKRADEALKSLGTFLETRSDEQGLRVVIEMLEALGKEFERAQQRKDEPRMAELAGHRAKVSRYLVERAASSAKAETRKLLPKYRLFEATSLQEAARLEKDAGRKKAYLDDALKIYREALAESPEDRGVQLSIAFVQFDAGDVESAQKTLGEFFAQHLLGKPMVMVSGPDGDQMKPNNYYWHAMLTLLRCNVELNKRGHANFGPAVLEDTKTKIKQLYITWGEPGGPRWAGQFEELRKEILPDWTPPSLEVPTTQPR